ncbi:hypothetical protein Cantr_06508 [Candida viswanathii]|uniref:C3H1-type domain-containing protein n=1 Tax=Candida viswanathii TaxID=5486 RepID=A0A367XVL1_9ASCO|nr:hypothetical protein Cantr_06508 [Candida viswanathii]
MSNNLFILDLPTYLPNEAPKEPEIKPKGEPLIPPQDVDEDDEEKQAKSNGPMCIPGTAITLETEEDIARWIEERKRNWPSNQNIERKKQEAEAKKQQQRLKRKHEGAASLDQVSPKKPKNICRFYQMNKKCKFGNKCKNLHEDPKNDNPVTSSFNELTHYRKFVNGVPVLIPKLYANRTENTLVKKLVLFKHIITRDQEVRENNRVLEFIKYLNEKGLIDHNVMKS